MATDQQIIDQALVVQDLANMLISYDAGNDAAVEYNQNIGIDWNNVGSTNPDALDADGNVKGTSSSPLELSNVLGSMDNFRTTFMATHRVNFDNVRSTNITKSWR